MSWFRLQAVTARTQGRGVTGLASMLGEESRYRPMERIATAQAFRRRTLTAAPPAGRTGTQSAFLQISSIYSC